MSHASWQTAEALADAGRPDETSDNVSADPAYLAERGRITRASRGVYTAPGQPQTEPDRIVAAARLAVLIVSRVPDLTEWLRIVAGNRSLTWRAASPFAAAHPGTYRVVVMVTLARRCCSSALGLPGRQGMWTNG